jgi:hypothetical protein
MDFRMKNKTNMALIEPFTFSFQAYGKVGLASIV